MGYISDYEKKIDGLLQRECSGYFAKLKVGSEGEICFVSGDNDIHTIGELINNFGYTAESLLDIRVVISIEDEKLRKLGG